MFNTVQEIVYQITGVRRIAMDTDFVRDLALNSFDIINIVCAFEERYKIEIPIRDVWNLNTVKDVIAYLTSRGVS